MRENNLNYSVDLIDLKLLVYFLKFIKKFKDENFDLKKYVLYIVIPNLIYVRKNIN